MLDNFNYHSQQENLPELVNKPSFPTNRPQSTLTSTDANNAKNLETDEVIIKSKMDDKTREGILKALSVYADQLYTKIGSLFIFF